VSLDRRPQNWLEIGEANKASARTGLPRHPTAEKNWDLDLLRRQLDGAPKSSRIVDLGCGEGYALKFLSALGFTNLLGIDLTLSWRLRAAAWKRALRRQRAFSIRRGDILATGLPPGSADFAVCISVIEHGVPIEPFLREAARILRTGGVLFITTDYWPETIEGRSGNFAFGLPWKPFDRQSLAELVSTAARHGLSPATDQRDESAEDRCVVWAGCEYTFVAIALRKGG
jgi:SAM-dependent methyltransferase